MIETVVKLGGSQALSPTLRPWLRALAGVPGIVVVPGGGPFADAVRAAQPAMGFDDRAAHHMALLAMAQYGLALAALEPRLVPADGLDAIGHVASGGLVPVWLPWPMLRDAPGLPASWDVTSDSLALWLAGALGARRLLLVKPRAAETGAVAALVRDGLVDPAFPRFLAGFAGEVRIAGPADLPHGPLDPCALPGQRVAQTEAAPA